MPPESQRGLPITIIHSRYLALKVAILNPMKLAWLLFTMLSQLAWGQPSLDQSVPSLLKHGGWAESSAKQVPFLTWRRIQRERPALTLALMRNLERAGWDTATSSYHHLGTDSRTRNVRTSQSLANLKQAAERLAMNPLLASHPNSLRHAAVRGLYFLNLLEKGISLSTSEGNKAAVFILATSLSVGLQLAYEEDNWLTGNHGRFRSHGEIGDALARKLVVIIREIPSSASRYRMTRALFALHAWDEHRDMGNFSHDGANESLLRLLPEEPFTSDEENTQAISQLQASAGMAGIKLPAGFPLAQPSTPERLYTMLFFSEAYRTAVVAGSVVCSLIDFHGKLLIKSSSDGFAQEEVLQLCMAGGGEGPRCLDRLVCNRIPTLPNVNSLVVRAGSWMGISFRW